MDKNISKSIMIKARLEGIVDISKGKKFPVGTIRTHGGKKVKKTADGKWVPVKESKQKKAEETPQAKKFVKAKQENGSVIKKMKDDMLINVSGAAIASDYRRRNIKPDEITPVRQGILLSWRFNNAYVCVLLLGAKNYNGELQPGQILLYDGPYINTYSFQNIADNLAEKIE